MNRLDVIKRVLAAKIQVCPDCGLEYLPMTELARVECPKCEHDFMGNDMMDDEEIAGIDDTHEELFGQLE